MYTLLIVEDEEDIRENIKEVFELSGDEVFSAANGADGLNLARKLKPDLILCDISMPVLDGFQLKKALANSKITSSIPFIYLTAKADLLSMREGMNLGADDYIVKPIHAKDLVNTVYKRISRISELRSPEIKKDERKRLMTNDKIPLNTGKEHLFITVANIVAINVKEDYTMVFTNDGKKILIKKTIKSWENILPEKTFIRAHRNILINTNFIDKIEPWFNGALIAKIKNYPEMIKFSKRYSQQVKKMLKNP